MSNVDIGSLSFRVSGNAKDAAESLNALRASLVALKSATANNKNLTEVANGIRMISAATSSLTGGGTAALMTATTALKNLKGVSIPKSLITGIQGLKDAFNGFTVGDLSGLASIANATAAFSGQDYTGLAQFANSMSKAVPIFNQLNGLSISNASANITGMVRAMSALSGLDATANFGSTLNQLKKVPEIVNTLAATDTKGFRSKVKDLSNALGASGLQSIEKAGGFTSTLNALRKLPEIFKQLETVNMDAFAAKIREVAAALEPLATQLSSVGVGLQALPGIMNRATLGTTAFATSLGTMGSRFSRFLNIYFLARVVRIFGQIINKATSYIENVNLFTVAMGEYADSAMKYAEKVSDIMGIDTSEWIRAQGVFRTLASGFGVAADRANIMSQNLTQLAYDISSFYNLDISNAIEKLEAAFSGDIKPVRKLGYDLSKVTLQATAADLGITKLWTDMTQAEKSQLRYYVLMTQVTQVQGDMARTLNAPANQLRILKAQLEMAARAIGNVFIPMLNAVLPYLIAVARFIRAVADEIASLLGFEIPEIDYSGMNVGIDDADDAVGDLEDDLNGAYGSAKKLKNLLASFDELNIITSESGGGAGGHGGTGGISDGWIDFALPTYDFLNNVLKSRADEVFDKWRGALEKIKPVLKWIVDHFSQIWDVIKAVALGLIGWKLSKPFLTLLSLIPSLGKLIGSAKHLKLGITLAITGFALEFSGARAIGAGTATLWDYVKTAIGAALGIAGSLLIFGTGPVGWTIGIGAAVTMFIVGFSIGKADELRREMEAAFFDSVGRPITEMATEFSDRMGNIQVNLKPLKDIANQIDALDPQISKASTAFSGLIMSLEEGTVVTTEQADEIRAAFDELYEGMEEKFSLMSGLIRDSLVVAMQNAAADVGISVNAILGEFARITGVNETRLSDLRNQATTIISSLAGMTVGSEEYNNAISRLGEITKEMAALTGTMSPAIGDWERFKESVSEGVNFESVEDATSAISNMAAAAKAAKDDIDAAYRESDTYILTMLNYARDYAPDQVPFWEQFRAANKAAFDAQKAGIDNDFVNMAADIQSSISDKFGNVVFEIGGTGPNAYTATALTFAKDFIGPISDELQKGFDALGIDGQVWGKDAIEEIVYAMQGTLIHGEGATALERLNNEMDTNFETLGEAVIEYFKRGMDAKTAETLNSVKDIGKDFGNSFTDGMNSRIAAGTDAIGRKFNKWWEQFRPVSGSSNNPASWFGPLTIQPYATGGFPQAGSLFLAGEGRGAELVGSIGGHTAVANGDQIVAGIANGVAAAQTEQNGLLREQNTILRQILQTGGQVVFVPSAEAGQAVQRSLNMYNVARGY